MRDLLADRCPPAGRARARRVGDPYDPALWRTLAGEIGRGRAARARGAGGAGRRPRGRPPWCWRSWAGPSRRCRSSPAPCSPPRRCWPAGDGRPARPARRRRARRPRWRCSFAAVPVPAASGCVGARGGRRGRLTGTVTGVAGADVADVLLVPVDGGLYARATRRRGRRPSVPSLDLTRPLADVTLDGAAGRRGRARRGPRRCAALLAGAGAARLRAARRRRVVPGHDGGLRQGAPPVRPAGRLVPGAQAPAGRPVARGESGPRGGPATRPPPGRRRPGPPVAAAVAQAYCSAVAVHAAEEACSCTAGSA